MTEVTEMARDLRAHLALCEELLLVVERESQALRTAGGERLPDFSQFRKKLLPQLDASLARIKRHRAEWQRQNPELRQQNPEIASLLRLNQDLVMKIIMLDRENEQCRLRRGMLPPQQLPSAHRQHPHYVADLYRRHLSG